MSPQILKNGSVKKVVPLVSLSRRLRNVEVGRVCEVSEQRFPNVKMPTSALNLVKSAVSGLVGLN